ncbi:MAG TPA: carboxypeptidase regulatory-like domain-containing protein [Verrucomicrobiae bacterium]
MKAFHKFLILLALGLALNLRADTNNVAQFSGTVVDAQGNPVANANVDCYQYSSRNSVGRANLEKKQHATTDANGSFAFPAFQAYGLVLVTKAGVAPTWRTWYSAPQDSQKIVLSTPSTLAGVVADDTGRPVADVEVSVSSALNKTASDIGQPNFVFGNVTHDLFSTRTSADGRFEIDNFPADSQAALAVKIAGKALRESSSPYRYDQLPYHAGQDDITLTLDPAGSISGKVVARTTGQPLAGAMVSLQEVTQSYSGPDEEPIQSAADGSFEISDVPAGSYNVVAEFTNQPIPDWVADSVPVKVAVGAATSGVQLQAIKGGVLQVTVHDKTTHEPIAGASVNISDNSNGNRSGATGSDGITYVRSTPGDYYLNVNKQDWGLAQTQVTVTDGQTTQVSVDLAEPLKISGIVRDASGAPVAGASVMVLPNYGNGTTDSKTDAKGHYEVSWNVPSWVGQSQQDFYLVVRATAQKLAALQEISDTTTNQDVNLKPAMSLSGSVHDTKGHVVTNAAVYIMLYEENSSFTVSRQPIPVDAQGNIQVEGLPLGERYGFSIYGNGYGSAHQEMDAADPKADHHDFPPLVVKIADRKLAGRVLGENGSPAVGANVWMNGDGQPNGNAITDADGRFVFDAVCEGSVTLNANLKNASGQTQAMGGNTNVVIRMESYRPYSGGNSQTLTGTVSDPAGSPIAGIRVVVTPSFGQSPTTKTDDKGAYSVKWQAQPGMQGAKYFVIARDTEHNLAAIEAISTTTKTKDLKLGPGLTISGTVQDAKGAPLARANINLNMMAGNMGGLVEYGGIKVNSDGAFTIPALPMGQRYMVFASMSGYGQAQKNIGIAQSNTNSIQLAAFKLKAADRELAGRVLGADGKPLAGANVFINGKGQPNGNANTDENGHFEFKVCDGPVNVYAWSQSGRNNNSANVDAFGGDTNVVVKMGGQRQRRAATVANQIPLKPQPWTLAAVIAWPMAHKTGAVILLSLQVLILLGTCAGIFLFTRKQG